MLPNKGKAFQGLVPAPVPFSGVDACVQRAAAAINVTKEVKRCDDHSR